MNSENPETNIGGFAATLNSRLAAQTRVARAVGFAWLCGGFSIFICLTALGFSLALMGYSRTISVKSASDEIARALVTALKNTDLKTNISGTVTLNPDSKLQLAQDQTVKLDRSSSVIKLDPNSSIRVIGDLKIDIPQPSKQQLQQDTTSQSNDIPITDYTVFRSVPFGKGEVVSGWNFDLSDTIHPKFQYCYYSEDIEKGINTRLRLAINGSTVPSAAPKAGFDLNAAATNCSWFSGY